MGGETIGLSVLLLDDERSHIVPSLVVVFGVGPVTVRELQAQLGIVRRGEDTVALVKQPFVRKLKNTEYARRTTRPILTIKQFWSQANALQENT